MRANMRVWVIAMGEGSLFLLRFGEIGLVYWGIIIEGYGHGKHLNKPVMLFWVSVGLRCYVSL
jgi:hypothetical protein